MKASGHLLQSQITPVLLLFILSGAADKATGSDKRNRHLSTERAKYIGKQLIKRGISKDYMKATSLGGINQFSPKEANRFGVFLLTH